MRSKTPFENIAKKKMVLQGLDLVLSHSELKMASSGNTACPDGHKVLQEMYTKSGEARGSRCKDMT